MEEHPSDEIEQLQGDYLRALVAGSGREADKVVTVALDQALSPQRIYLEIFQPTAYAIGQLWQRNKVSVAQEHLATAIVERQMGELHPMFKPAQERPHTLVLGCVPDEWHRVGARMVADFFEADGWTVHYLGANVPIKELVGLARESNADLVGLSAEMLFNLPKVAELVRALDAAGLGGLPVIAGGMPFILQSDLAQALSLRGSADNAEAALDLANQIVRAGTARVTPTPEAAAAIALRVARAQLIAEATARCVAAGDSDTDLISAGYGYVLRMLEAALVAESSALLDSQIYWANERQPHDGVSPEQLLVRLAVMAATVRALLPGPEGEVAATYLDRMVDQHPVG
jgi:MerR family transcriptional regulator, light-induced transcriptional regulator